MINSEPEMVLSANEVMLQHCVLKAVLTVLDSEPGLEYILDHEELLASIFTSIQVRSFDFFFFIFRNKTEKKRRKYKLCMFF